MKYIRTEKNIYEWIYNDYEIKAGEFYRTTLMKEHELIVDVADTIEKLCDEFVVIYNENKKFKKPFTSFYSDIISVLHEHDLSECKIYGAIWTNKGLIYVAKMNDKGELELL